MRSSSNAMLNWAVTQKRALTFFLPFSADGNSDPIIASASRPLPVRIPATCNTAPGAKGSKWLLAAIRNTTQSSSAEATTASPPPPIWRAPGKKVLVLERRHVLGGAAVTEEVFPGFKFSVCSYVVSLLRPEIIRDLDLPRHGLEILPLDGTFTPMPNGDYLWRVNDHGKTHREIARHSKA